jgi:hypothetical protein
LRRKVQSVGTKVSERINEPIRANEMVNARGANILPSNPSSVNRGKKTMMIIAMPNTMGRPTSLAA